MLTSMDTMHYLDKIYETREIKAVGSVNVCLHIFNAQTNESNSIRYDIRELTLNVVR